MPSSANRVSVSNTDRMIMWHEMAQTDLAGVHGVAVSASTP